MKRREQVEILESLAHSWNAIFSSSKLSQMVKPSRKFKPKHRSKNQTNQKPYCLHLAGVMMQKDEAGGHIPQSVTSQRLSKCYSICPCHPGLWKPHCLETSILPCGGEKKKESLLHGTENEERIVLTALLNSLKAARLLNIGPDDSRPWFCGYKPRIWSLNSHSKV